MACLGNVHMIAHFFVLKLASLVRDPKAHAACPASLLNVANFSFDLQLVQLLDCSGLVH